ncbi:MAG: asparagine synthase (glutamine-hydrolyzing) [Patescibacteria group bacterium]
MCGIGGYCGEGTREVLQSMNSRLAHRGPDGEGVWIAGRVGFAHRRLAIIDLSPAAAQPMRRGSVVITFNGEIYNYQQLRENLVRSGVSFVSQSDTEVILALFEREGEKAFELLEGMFAFALYDEHTEDIYLVRDRFGEKPLYYAVKGESLIFASEPKALFVHPLVSREISPEGLSSFLLYDTPVTPASMWRDVKKVPVATCLKFKRGVLSERRYWHPTFSKNDTSLNDDLEQVGTLIRSSVERQLASDVPLGVFLSGGVDSSLIAAYAHEIAGDIHTFSIGFEEKSYDESAHARRVANHLGTQHHERILCAQEVRDTLVTLVPYMDEPIADPAILPTHLLSRFARERVTVALTGDGGDELFLGYPTFFAEQLLRMYQHVPQSARRALEPLASFLPASHRYMSADFLIKQFLRGAEKEPLYAHQGWLSGFSSDEVREVLAEGFHDAIEDPCIRTDRLLENMPNMTPLSRSSWWYARTVLDLYLTKADRASMFASLETRAPLLDRALAEFALALPANRKLRHGKGKYILRKLAEQKLPHGIAWRRKHGFGLPVGAWLTHEWKPLLTDTLSCERVADAGLCDPRVVERFVLEHLSGSHNHRKKLWSLLTLHLWHNAWMR